MKRVLITGVSGFTGRAMVTYLRTQPVAIHGVGLSTAQLSTGWYRVDLRNAAEIHVALQKIEPNYVLHFAKAPRASSLEEMLAVNVVGTHNLLEALRAEAPRARTLIVGSSAEYGMVDTERQPIPTSTPLNPGDLYGLSKATQSHLASQHVRRHGCPIIQARTFNLTGPGEPETQAASSFAKQIARIEKGLCPPVVRVGALATVRDYLDIRDAVRAYWRLVVEGTAGEMYHVCSGTGTTTGKILEILTKHARARFDVVEAPDLMTAWNVSRHVGDPSTLMRLHEFSWEYSLDDSLRDLLDDWRRRLSSESPSLSGRERDSSTPGEPSDD